MKAHGGAATALAVLAELFLMGVVVWIAYYILNLDDSWRQTSQGFPLFPFVSAIEFMVVLGLTVLLLNPLANYVADRSNHILEAVAVEN